MPLTGCWRGVRVGRSRLDRGLLRQRHEEGRGGGGHGVDDPAVREGDLALLTWIPLQVVEHREVERAPCRVEVVLLEQVQLPLVPLDRLQPVALDAQYRVAARLLGVTQQEVGHVHAVDLTVGRHRAAARFHQRREEVDLVDELVTDLPRGDLPRPANDARRSVRALERGEQRAPPRAGERVPPTARRVRVARRRVKRRVGTVVGRPHDDRVVSHAELVELVEDHSGEVVHLGQDVGPVALLGLAGVLGVGDRRVVDLRVGQVQVERLAVARRAGHEVARPVGDLAVETGAPLGVVVRQHLGLGALLARVDRLRLDGDRGLPGVRSRRQLLPFGEVRLHGPADLVCGARTPHRLVETEVDRAALLRIAAEMPLAPHTGRVARVRQRLRHRDLPTGQSVGTA